MAGLQNWFRFDFLSKKVSTFLSIILSTRTKNFFEIDPWMNAFDEFSTKIKRKYWSLKAESFFWIEMKCKKVLEFFKRELVLLPFNRTSARLKVIEVNHECWSL